ncbi:MAG: hypothetical protein QOD86_2473 [Miltoncostaeaceae bacterium]|jgi:hypothetical protein|nr:hypothetical protein [Miltoncostaeaceae bacterium]
MSLSMTPRSGRVAVAAALGLLAPGVGASAACAAPEIPVVNGWPVIGGFDSPGSLEGIDAQGNVYLDGYTRFTALGPGGDLRWTVDYQRTARSPFLSGDSVYSADGKSLDAFGTDGSWKWRRPFQGARTAAASGRAGGALVYGGGFIDSIGPDSVRRWSTPVGGVVRSPVTAPDGTVLAIVAKEKLVALDGVTGRIRWKVPVVGTSFRAPAVGGDGEIVVVGNSFSNGKTNPALVQAFSGDGSARWSMSVSGNVLGPAAINADGVTFVAVESGALRAIGPDGVQRWERPIARRFLSGPVVGTDGRVSILSTGAAGGVPRGTLTTLDPTTGAIVASTGGLAPGLASVLPASGGRLFVQSGGYLWQLDPAAKRTRVARYAARLTETSARLKVRPRQCEGRSSRQVCVFSGESGTMLELRASHAGKATVQIRRVTDGRLLAMRRAVEVPAGISRLRLGGYRCLDETTSCTAPGRYRVSIRFTRGQPPVTVSAGVLRVLPSAGRVLF